VSDRSGILKPDDEISNVIHICLRITKSSF